MTAALPLASWDWWYYAEKIKKAEYDLDEAELRPYFKMENVRKGAFDVASRLYGLQFIERKDIPKYADDVEVFEVKDGDGSHLGILYTDYFLRRGKRPGAWMGSFRDYARIGDSVITPLIYNVGNFSGPTTGTTGPSQPRRSRNPLPRVRSRPVGSPLAAKLR